MAFRRGSDGVSLHRFFLPDQALRSDRVVFRGDQTHQILHVLRLRVGDRVAALDGTGGEAVVRLVEIGPELVGVVEERRRNEAEPKTQLTLYQGLLKAAKLELILQKCTEVGAAAFVPVQTQRSIPWPPSASRQQRFEAIVREAAEQSLRGRLPPVSQVISFSESITLACGGGLTVLLWERESRAHLDQLPPCQPGEALNLFVGPEGGFALEEVAQAREAGAHVITLGRRILRAETAAIVATALLLARQGDLG